MRRLIALLFIIVAESSAQDAPADDVLNERLAITAQQLLSDAGIEATNIYVNSPMFPIDQLVCSVIAKFPELFPGILRNFEHLENYDREGCIARRLWFDRVEDIDEDDFKVAIRSRTQCNLVAHILREPNSDSRVELMLINKCSSEWIDDSGIQSISKLEQ